MKNVFLVMIAIISLAACGKNKDKNAKSTPCQPGVSGCYANQAAYPVGIPHGQVGLPGGQYGGNYPGTHGPIVGEWCSIDSRIQFDQDGAVAMTKTDGSAYFGRYASTTGILVIGGVTVRVKAAPATAQSPSLLYVLLPVGRTEIMEPCDQYQDKDDKDQDDKDDDDNEEDSKPKPKPQPKPYPKPMPVPPLPTQDLPPAPPST